MHELSRLGPLQVVSWRQGCRVQIAKELAVGDIRIPVPEEPRILLVPQNIEYLQQMWDALRMPTRNNLLVTGESGSGKTTLIRYLGEIYRHASRRASADLHDSAATAHAAERVAAFQTRILTFHENLRRSDITERRHYGETGEEKTGWTMSDVMDGMVAGDWNILSEINRTGEDVQAEFNEPLENKAKSLHQRVIRGHPDSRFIATVNPVKSEGRGIYEGRVMSGEFINRFTNKVHLRFLPHDQEFEVLKSYGTGVDDQVIDRLIAIAGDIRRDYAEEHGVVPFPVTTRSLIRMIRHLAQFPEDTSSLRSLFWRKAYWLDDRIHPPVAKRLVEDLLDLHDITDGEQPSREGSRIIMNGAGGRACLKVGGASYPIGPGGSYVPDTEIEEVQQNLTDLEWILKDIVLGENVLLIGEAGVGKNKIESYLAHLLNYNLLVIGMSGETRVSDLLTYRSFGEEEAGRTGDTATLGLKALADPDQGWIIVLDEANKAHPGVLVSFNDLLQDRLVRLPGGSVVPVRASIFVNINPNRPPYEVNDFSFEFMDRFSIHTILHLPAEQASDVLRKKYPDADLDFVTNVVRGYYTLHPLYSSGILFEPVTMRNEEAAIERGLQQPGKAVNLIDLLTSCYGPKDGRERHAIQAALQADGFDRNVLASAQALEVFRNEWEADKNNEKNAVALAGTYQAIGKPMAALDVLRLMIGRHPGREWVFHLMGASIYLDNDQPEEANAAIRMIGKPGSVIAMDNGEKYLVLGGEVSIASGKIRSSFEAKNIRSGSMSLICGISDATTSLLCRSQGVYSLVFSDKNNSLAVYEWQKTPALDETSPLHETRGRGLGRLVQNYVDLSYPEGEGFLKQFFRLPFPLFTDPQFSGEDLVRELSIGKGSISVLAHQDGGWTIREDERGKWEVGWNPASEAFFFKSPAGKEITRLPAASDPFLGLAFQESSGILYLVLSDDIAERADDGHGKGMVWGRGVPLALVSTGVYHDRVLSPILDQVLPRLQHIFRYSRAFPGYDSPGFGDIVYTLSPGRVMGIGIIIDVNGFGPVLRDIPQGDCESDDIRRERGEGPFADPVFERMVIPFSLIDDSEEWFERASSTDIQQQLRNIRKYTANVLLASSQPRDLAFEAKARSFVADRWEVAMPIEQTTILCRGDILVRYVPGKATPDSPPPIFIVRFVQEGSSGGLTGSVPVVRGFFLAEQNPVATLDITDVVGKFGLLFVDGDDRYDHIIRHLVAACQESALPFSFSRSGPPHDPFMKLETGGFSISFRPLERHFCIVAGQKGENPALTIVEDGYPAETASAADGAGRQIRWQGLPVMNVRYEPFTSRLFVILEAEFLDAMNQSGIFTGGAVTIPGQPEIWFCPRSEAEEE